MEAVWGITKEARQSAMSKHKPTTRSAKKRRHRRETRATQRRNRA